MLAVKLAEGQVCFGLGKERMRCVRPREHNSFLNSCQRLMGASFLAAALSAIHRAGAASAGDQNVETQFSLKSIHWIDFHFRSFELGKNQP